MRCELFVHRQDFSRLPLPGKKLAALLQRFDEARAAVEALEEDLAALAIREYPEMQVPIVCLAPAAANQPRLGLS